jgi:hypothetical protein
MPDPRCVFPDNIYKTLSCTNNTQYPSSLTFSSNCNSDVVNNPSMYYLLVEKFVLPNNYLPIFYFDNTDGMYVVSNPKHGTQYLLKMTNVYYYGDHDLITDGNPDSSFLTGPVYFVKQFIDMLNESFVQIGVTMTFSISIDGKFHVTNGDSVYLSRKIYNMFPTLPAIYTGIPGREYLLRGINGVVQEQTSQYAFNDIRSILLISNDLPILHQGFTTNSDSNQKLKILNEFPVIESAFIDKTAWVFESNQYRPIDMISQEGFGNFTFTVRLLTKKGIIREYKLLPGESASCTFRFVKKALFNNEYNLSSEAARIKQNPEYSYHKR